MGKRMTTATEKDERSSWISILTTEAPSPTEVHDKNHELARVERIERMKKCWEFNRR